VHWSHDLTNSQLATAHLQWGAILRATRKRTNDLDQFVRHSLAIGSSFLDIKLSRYRRPKRRTAHTPTMSYPSLAPFVAKRPWLHSLLKPLASWYGNAAGYRQLGLLFVATLPVTLPLSMPPRTAN